METNVGILFIIKNFFPGHFGLINDYETVLLLVRFFFLRLSHVLSAAKDSLTACRVRLPPGYRNAGWKHCLF